MRAFDDMGLIPMSRTPFFRLCPLVKVVDGLTFNSSPITIMLPARFAGRFAGNAIAASVFSETPTKAFNVLRIISARKTWHDPFGI